MDSARGWRASRSFGNLATLRQVQLGHLRAGGRRGGVLGKATRCWRTRPLGGGGQDADCLPILLVDERHRAVAAVHAGWRDRGGHRPARGGSHGRAVRRAAGISTPPSSGIGQCCYEWPGWPPSSASRQGTRGSGRGQPAAALGCGVTPEALRVESVHHAGRDFTRSGATKSSRRLYSFAGILQAVH